MNYGSGKISKLQHTKVLAACFAHVILTERDAVALAMVGEEIQEYLPRTDSQQKIQHIMDRLAAFQGKGGTHLGNSLQQVARQAKRRGIVIIMSDLFDDEEGLARRLELSASSGNEVIIRASTRRG